MDSAGEVVKWVQTSALLEVVHAGTGLVWAIFLLLAAEQ